MVRRRLVPVIAFLALLIPQGLEAQPRDAGNRNVDFSQIRHSVQLALNILGFDVGTVDGKFGRKTRLAIRKYQRSIGVQATGRLTGEQTKALLLAANKAMAARRNNRNVQTDRHSTQTSTQIQGEKFQRLIHTDLRGDDIRDPRTDPSLKRIGVPGCEAACAAEPRCAAFTYNTTSGWCFLKGSAGQRVSFTGAVSGIKTTTLQTTANANARLFIERWPGSSRNRRPTSINTKIAGLYQYTPRQKLYWSQTHKRAVALANAKTAQGKIDLRKVRQAMSLLTQLMEDIRREHGTGSALEGNVLVDFAKAQHRDLKDVYDVDEIRAADTRYGETQKRAIDYLSGYDRQDARFKRVLAEQRLEAITAIVGGGMHCDSTNSYKITRSERASLWLQAVDTHSTAFGTDALQVGWLRKAAECAPEIKQRIEIHQRRAEVADTIRNPLARFWAAIDLATTLAESKDDTSARRSFKTAFQIYRSHLTGSSSGINFITDSAFEQDIGDETMEALHRLGLKDELTIVLQGQVNEFFRKEMHTYNAGISYVWSLGARLERFGAFKLADSLYRRFGSGPIAFATHFTAAKDYDTSNLILGRALKAAEQRRAHTKRLEILVLSAQNYFDAGDHSQSEVYANRALKLIAGKKRLRRAKQHNKKLRALLASIQKERGRQSVEESPASAKAQELFSNLDKAIATECLSGTPVNERRVHDVRTAMQEILAESPEVAAAGAKASSADQFLACFGRNRPHFYGFKRNYANSNLSAGMFGEAAAIFALRDDRPSVARLLKTVFNDAHWPVVPGRYRSKVENREQLEAIQAIYRNLARQGKRTWFAPFLPKLLNRLSDDRLKRIGSNNYVDIVLAQIGTIFAVESLQPGAERIERTIQRFRKAEGRSPKDHRCESVETCEFLGLMAEEAGNINIADKIYDNLSNTFVVNWSGASATVAELDRIQEMAIAEGEEREALGRYRLARTYFEIAGGNVYNANSDARSVLSDITRIRAADGLARTNLKLGELKSAMGTTRPILSAVRAKFEKGLSFQDDAVVSWANRLRGLMQTHLALVSQDDGAVDASRLAETFFAGQYLQATRTGATVGRLASRLKARNKSVANLIRQHQDGRRSLARLYKTLADQQSVAAAPLLKRIKRQETRVQAIGNKLTKADPDYFAHARLQIAGLDDVRELMSGEEALFSAYVGSESVYAWWVSSKGTRFAKLDISPDQLREKVAALRQNLDPTNLSDVDLGAAHELYTTILGPFEAELASARHLYFVPNGSLDGLPLGVLVTEAPDRALLPIEEIRSERPDWLIRKMAVSTLPSVAALKILRGSRQAAEVKQRPFFGVGNPVFAEVAEDASSTRNLQTIRLANLAGGRGATVKVPPLPETEFEIKAIAGLLGADTTSDLLLGQAASEAELRRRNLEQYQVIAFATHGLIAGELENFAEPGLLLATPKKAVDGNDGLLSASEIAQLKLNADLVILSACNTAASDGRPGAEGLSGLAKAFFYAGARRLMVTHWAIPSEPAVEITTGMIAAKKGGDKVSWAEALRQSVLKLIDEKGSVLNAHPASWGAYIIVGPPSIQTASR